MAASGLACGLGIIPRNSWRQNGLIAVSVVPLHCPGGTRGGSRTIVITATSQQQGEQRQAAEDLPHNYPFLLVLRFTYTRASN